MKGLIFIPDINGFTKFVQSVDIETGMAITRTLLQVIMENNDQDLEVSEIEGDAILFYKMGKPHPLSALVNSFIKMQNAFKARYNLFKKQYHLKVDLSLKLIVHYGDMMIYNLHGFKKLYGETIIEAHRLLKEGHPSDDFILVTEQYMKAVQVNMSDVLVPGRQTKENECTVFEGIRRIAFQGFKQTQRNLVLQP